MLRENQVIEEDFEKKERVNKFIKIGLVILIINWGLYTIAGILNLTLLPRLLPFELLFVGLANYPDWRFPVYLILGIIIEVGFVSCCILFIVISRHKMNSKYSVLLQAIKTASFVILIGIGIKLVFSIIVKILTIRFQKILYEPSIWEFGDSEGSLGRATYTASIVFRYLIPLVDGIVFLIVLFRLRSSFTIKETKNVGKRIGLISPFVLIPLIIAWLGITIWAMNAYIALVDPYLEIMNKTLIYYTFMIPFGGVMLIAFIEVFWRVHKELLNYETLPENS